ncbi:hypothetical protein EB118_22300 [bacterium]|nr:hypothetical protein [bacterium]NDD83228.1 hypothetical protein [bacterium]NDG32788.1 hypothetical protein [bacterium]
MSLSYNNSILAQTISVSGTNTSVTGVLIATSGNFTNSLQVNNVNVSVSGHNHDASAINTGTFDDSRLSSNVVLYPQFNNVLGQASSVIDAVSRVLANGAVTATANQLLVSFFTPTTTTTISQISMSTAGGAVASGVTLARMGIYTYPTDGGTATLVARTASDTSLFAANSTLYTRSLDSTGGYPATYTLNAGTRYGVAYVVVGTTQPQLVGRVVVSSVAGLSPRISGASGTQSDLPTSFTPGSNSQAPFARLS